MPNDAQHLPHVQKVNIYDFFTNKKKSYWHPIDKSTSNNDFMKCGSQAGWNIYIYIYISVKISCQNIAMSWKFCVWFCVKRIHWQLRRLFVSTCSTEIRTKFMLWTTSWILANMFTRIVNTKSLKNNIFRNLLMIFVCLRKSYLYIWTLATSYVHRTLGHKYKLKLQDQKLFTFINVKKKYFVTGCSTMWETKIQKCIEYSTITEYVVT
jgi:hypothetical protein